MQDGCLTERRKASHPSSLAGFADSLVRCCTAFCKVGASRKLDEGIMQTATRGLQVLDALAVVFVLVTEWCVTMSWSDQSAQKSMAMHINSINQYLGSYIWTIFHLKGLPQHSRLNALIHQSSQILQGLLHWT